MSFEASQGRFGSASTLVVFDWLVHHRQGLISPRLRGEDVVVELHLTLNNSRHLFRALFSSMNSTQGLRA